MSRTWTFLNKWNERTMSYKKLHVHTRSKSARTKHVVNKGLLQHLNTIVLVYVCVIRTETVKLKLVLNLFGLSKNQHSLKTFFLMLLVTDVAASALL